jgi:hypothetical protein
VAAFARERGSDSACVQISELAELLVLLGHEADAATLQSALDAYVKEFIAAAEEIAAAPPPPATPGQPGLEAAAKSMRELQQRLYEVKRATWKWDLLRPVDT